MPTTALPVLYSFRRCPYAMRARLALVASGQRCELREVVLRDKPAGLLAASPKGTVPVLVVAPGKVLEQSLDIMLWALRRSDPLRWLQPAHGTLAESLAVVAACDGSFKAHLDRYKYPVRFPAVDSAATLHELGAMDDRGATTHRDLGARFLAELEDRLTRTAQLFGDTASLADAAVMPFVRQFSMVEPDWFAAQPWPRLQLWLAHWRASTLFARVMHKYPAWRADAEGVSFPTD